MKDLKKKVLVKIIHFELEYGIANEWPHEFEMSLENAKDRDAVAIELEADMSLDYDDYVEPVLEWLHYEVYEGEKLVHEYNGPVGFPS